MESFIEHLLNSAYHYQRQRLVKLYSQEPKTYASSHIRFGGWEISYNGKGRSGGSMWSGGMSKIR